MPKQNPVWQSLAMRPATIQPKLSVSQPNDPDEREADRVASNILSSRPMITHTKTNSDITATGIPDHVRYALADGGRPLKGETRAHFEPSLGSGLDHIRVHEGRAANHSARMLDAQAYTVGPHIVLGREESYSGSSAGRRLMAHEVAHAVSPARAAQPAIMRQTPAAAQATTAPMTREQFEQTLRDRFAVVDIHTGTQEEQASLANVEPAQLTNWSRWDPGAASNDYALILRAFENFSSTFGGAPNVREVIFFQHRYDRTPTGGAQADPSVGASFAVGRLTIHRSFSGTRTLPVARSNASGTYPPMVAVVREEGSVPGAPLPPPTREQNIERNIVHELGHGLAEAVMGSIPDLGLDPSMMRNYAWEVGWATRSLVGLTRPGLYDIGVPAVAEAFNNVMAPPVQYQITPNNWNDPRWIEQPISHYMVSVSEGEDFAEAVRTFVESPELLRQRSPHRYNFLERHRAEWQSRLLRPHTRQRGSGVALGIYLVVDDPDKDPLNFHRLEPYRGLRDRGQIVEVSHDADGYYYMWRGRRIQLHGRP